MPPRPRIRPPVGKSGPRNDLGQLVDRDGGIADIGDAGVDHLAEIVRRDVGGHADSDAAGAIDEKVREARRQDRRLLHAPVIIVLEVDGLLVDVLEEMLGDLGEAALRCNASPPADRRQPSRNCPARRSAAGAWRTPAPCAPGVVDRAGRRGDGYCPSPRRRRAADLRKLLFQSSPILLHRVEDAAMHGLQAVAHVGQRARYDHAHGVIEIGALHLVDERDGADVRARPLRARSLDFDVVVVSQWRDRLFWLCGRNVRRHRHDQGEKHEKEL